MLIEFKVANYRSIRAEQTLSMVASNYSDELPQNLISCDHVPGLKGTKLVKAVALYGANASGKSNIVAALRFFAEFVRDSATKLQPGAPTGAQPFKLDPKCLTEPSKFEITAVINGIRTLYGIELTRERVTSEYLVAYPKGRPQVWFERDWDEAKGKYAWSKSTEHFKHDAALREKTRENAAFVSVAAQFNQEQCLLVWKFLSEGALALDLIAHPPDWTRSLEMLRDPAAQKKIVEALKIADLGIQDARIRKAERMSFFEIKIAPPTVRSPEPDPMAVAMKKHMDRLYPPDRPELLHRTIDGGVAPLDFETEESSGTQRYFNLLGEWLRLEEPCRLLVADEIETSLHPTLLNSLIKALFETPKSRTQFLFTTHNPLLLDQTLLRRDQIWFTEKDQEGATRLYPLTDFKPRKDESLVKGYLAGRYGGIPFIPEGLKF